MKTKKQLIKECLELARKNIPPAPKHLEISLAKGGELAQVYQANQEIVLIGICLMDICLSEAMKEGKQKEHVKMSADFSKQFLKNYDITKEEYEKIINCVEAHHGDVPFTCIEAEVCANADCYRFIAPVGVFTFLGVVAKREMGLLEQIEQAKMKLEEKQAILSLDRAKEELEPSYQMFAKLFHEVLDKN